MHPIRFAIILALTAPLQTASSQAGEWSTACSERTHRAFDFWLGMWRVTDATTGARVGRNVISSDARGCAIRETYRSGETYRGTSVSWFDALSGFWRQLWVDSDGLVLDLHGGPDSTGMVLVGETRTGDTVRTHRIRWFRESGGTVRQQWDASTDWGQSWKRLFDGRYTRDSTVSP